MHIFQNLETLENEIRAGGANAAEVMESIHPELQRMGLLAQITEEGSLPEIPSEVLRKALTEGGLREKLRAQPLRNFWKTWTSAPEDWDDSPHWDFLLTKNLKGTFIVESPRQEDDYDIL